MMQKLFVAAAVAAVALSNTAAFACTSDELQAKAMEVSNRITALAQKDPQKASDWSQKMATQQAGANPSDMNAVCKMYDDMLASLPK